MFDATASKYSKIKFEKVNVDTHDPRCTEYNTSSIPRIVMLDDHNQVLYNGSAWGDPSGFAALLK